MYTVHAFNPTDGEIIFKFDNGRIHSINIYKSNFTKYENVNTFHHFVDTRSKSIVYLNLDNCSKTFTLDDKGILYRKANQYDYDKWMTKEYPNSDNAKIFNILIPNNK